MTHQLTSSDRSSLIRLASRLPKGDETRRAILSGLTEYNRPTKGDRIKVENEKGRKVWVYKETLEGPEGHKYKRLSPSDSTKKSLEKAQKTYGKEIIDSILEKASELQGAQRSGFLQSFERDELDEKGESANAPGWKAPKALLEMHKNKRPPSSLLVKLLKGLRK